MNLSSGSKGSDVYMETGNLARCSEGNDASGWETILESDHRLAADPLAESVTVCAEKRFHQMKI